jgi:hypothetical protein
MMTDQKQKYFKGRLYWRGKMYPYVVWDGVRSYKSTPPPELADAEQLYGKLIIAQLGKKPSNVRQLLSTLIETSDSIILWARDHTTYRAIVAEAKAFSDVRMM